MKKTHLIVFTLLVSLLLAAWGPPGSAAQAAASADLLTLTIKNKTTDTLTVTLTGPASYTVSAKPGKTKVDVAPGKYRYRYAACGAFRTGMLQVRRSGEQIQIAACAKQGKSKEIQFTMVNDTGGSLTLLLSGTAPYTFQVPSGKTKFTALKGKYTYTAYANCGTKTGTMSIKPNMEWEWWCE